MELVPSHDRDQLATKTDVALLGSELRVEMGDLRGEIGGLRGEMAELRGDMDRRFGEVLERMASHSRQHTTALIGFSLATWGALLGGAVLG